MSISHRHRVAYVRHIRGEGRLEECRCGHIRFYPLGERITVFTMPLWHEPVQLPGPQMTWDDVDLFDEAMRDAEHAHRNGDRTAEHEALGRAEAVLARYRVVEDAAQLHTP